MTRELLTLLKDMAIYYDGERVLGESDYWTIEYPDYGINNIYRFSENWKECNDSNCVCHTERRVFINFAFSYKQKMNAIRDYEEDSSDASSKESTCSMLHSLLVAMYNILTLKSTLTATQLLNNTALTVEQEEITFKRYLEYKADEFTDTVYKVSEKRGEGSFRIAKDVLADAEMSKAIWKSKITKELKNMEISGLTVCDRCGRLIEWNQIVNFVGYVFENKSFYAKACLGCMISLTPVIQNLLVTYIGSMIVQPTDHFAQIPCYAARHTMLSRKFYNATFFTSNPSEVYPEEEGESIIYKLENDYLKPNLHQLREFQKPYLKSGCKVLFQEDDSKSELVKPFDF